MKKIASAVLCVAVFLLMSGIAIAQGHGKPASTGIEHAESTANSQGVSHGVENAETQQAAHKHKKGKKHTRKHKHGKKHQTTTAAH